MSGDLIAELGKQDLTKAMIKTESSDTKSSEQKLKNSREFYEELALNAFRFLGCQTFEEVNKMTIREYELRMLAFNLQQVDEEMKRHQQAFLNDAVRAKNKKANQFTNIFLILRLRRKNKQCS